MKKVSAIVYIAIIAVSVPLYLLMLNNLSSIPILTVNFIIGIYLLVKGSDYFVEGAASIAAHKKISQHTIGLTLVALATSLPEFAVSTIASASNHPVTAWGNAVGSNIANIGLVLGVAAILMPLSLSKYVKRDALILLGVTALLITIALFTHEVAWWAGIIFIVIYIIYMMEIRRRKESMESIPAEHSILWSWIYTIFGAIGIVWGAEVVVKSAINIAIVAHIPEIIIAATAIAIGTSLPELATSVAAALKKKYGIAVGNVIGSNIFNTLIVLGGASLFNPIKISFHDITFNSIFLGVFTLTVALMCLKKRISRFEGLLLIIIYAIFSIMLIYSF